MNDKPDHVNHPEDERYDRITIDVKERWKESELSGDEWRFSYVVRAWRKGEIIVEVSWNTLEYALQTLQYTVNIWPADGKNFRDEAWDRTKDKCDQPGCAEVATIFYKRLKAFTKEGDEIAYNIWRNQYRQFCDRHKHRGDCDLDDADRNYVIIAKP